MGIINGKEFIDRLNKLENEIWYDGEKIKGNISEHPAFKGIIKTKSSLYELQTKDELIHEMIYCLPGDHNRIGLSYLQPKTKNDLKKKDHD